MKGVALVVLIGGFTVGVGVRARSGRPVERGVSLCDRDPGLCAWPGSKPPRETEGQASVVIVKPSLKPEKKVKDARDSSRAGNLPLHYGSANRTGGGGIDSVVLVAEKKRGAQLSGLRAGDILRGVLDQSVKASPGVPTPIRVRVTHGEFRNAYVLGRAVFDPELKRILFHFTGLRLPGRDTSYALKAAGLSPVGQVGLEGEHHTQEGKFFVGELLAATAAGVVDTTTQRSQTALGAYQTEPSLANAAKSGVVQGLAKTGERFAERARTAPEYTEIEGGREIQILLEESPVEEVEE